MIEPEFYFQTVYDQAGHQLHAVKVLKDGTVSQFTLCERFAGSFSLTASSTAITMCGTCQDLFKGKGWPRDKSIGLHV